MERLMKLLGLAVIVLVVSSTVSAATLFWGTPGNWTNTSFPGYGTAPSAAAGDYVYMYATATAANPLVITAGTSASADFVHLDAYGVWDQGLVVNGSLDTAGGAWNNLLWGSWYQSTGTSGIVTVNDGGSISTGDLGVYNPGYDPVNSYGTDTGDYQLILNGGTVTADHLRYNAELSFFIDIIFADDDAFLTCPTADFDAVNALGSIISGPSLGPVGMIQDNGDGTAVYGIVPEPATMVLLGLGCLVLRRKK